jgi:hypothetical protein
MPAAGGATQPPDKRRATSIYPIPQTLTFQSTDKRHFGQSLSLACNTEAQCVPSFKTQARTYFTTRFNLMGVNGDTLSLKARCHRDILLAGKSRWQVGYSVSLYCHWGWKSVYLPVTFVQCGKTLLTKLSSFAEPPHFQQPHSFLTHCGQVTQICVFNTVKLGTSASSP